MKIACVAALCLVGPLACSGGDQAPTAAPLGVTEQAATVSLPVNVVNTANSAVPVAVVGTPSVALSGPVTLAPGGAVSLVGTPTVNVGNLPAATGTQTVLVQDDTLTVQGFGFDLSDAVDVSGYKEIRVTASLTNGSDGCNLAALAFVDGQDVEPAVLEQDMLAGSLNGNATKTFTTPGLSLRLMLGGGLSGTCSVRVRVYGRSN